MDTDALTTCITDSLTDRYREAIEACKGAESALWLMVAMAPDGSLRDDAIAKHNALRYVISKASA